MDQLLKGKVAIVTGGTRGIGYAIVKKYIQEGATVVLCGSRESTAQEALAKVKAEFPSAVVDALAPDLTSVESVNKAFAYVKEKFGSIDIVANNAGISQNIPLEKYTEEDIDKIIGVNIKAVFVCSQAAANIMKEQENGGVIINTSSMVSKNGQPSGCAYPASKFAVNGFTKSLARELGKYKIRVNAVAPGITRTDMLAVLPDAMIQPLIKNIPLGRVGEPEDIANAFAFLASDMASFITGDILSVDGGSVV